MPASPPPPSGADVTVYNWVLGPTGDPCPSCIGYASTISLVPRSSPHAFCLCIGDIPNPVSCTFLERTEIETETETFEVPGPVVPANGGRTWTTNTSQTGGVSVTGSGDGASATVSGSTTSGETTEWDIDNPNDFPIQIFEIWNNINESWVDRVECGVFGFTFIHELPRNEIRQEFGGFRQRPYNG